MRAGFFCITLDCPYSDRCVRKLGKPEYYEYVSVCGLQRCDGDVFCSQLKFVEPGFHVENGELKKDENG